MLLPLKEGLVLEESGDKGYPVVFLGLGGGKMIFALLAEVQALYMGLVAIQVGKPVFQKPLTRYIEKNM